MKKFFKALFLILLLAIALIIAWSFIPNAKAPFSPDPAVEYLNKKSNSANLYKEAYFDYQGNKLHYVEAGEGPVVVLIHGFPSHWYAMSRQMEVLKDNYRVVAIDALGAGKSDAPMDKETYTLENQTKALDALLKHIGANEQVNLIGHDWGSAYAFAFAQKYPERVNKMVGISSPPLTILLDLIENNEEQHNNSDYVERLHAANAALLFVLNVPRRLWDGAYTRLVESQHYNQEESNFSREALKNPKRINAYLNWYRANLPKLDEITEANYWPSKNSTLNMPVLVIRGIDDKIFVPEYVDKTREISQSFQALELENTGHWPHVEQAEKVNAEIIAFLK